MKVCRFSFATTFASTTLFILIAFGQAYAFDISAYYDPYGVITNDWYRGNYYHSLCPQSTLPQVLLSVSNNEQVLDWYDEMGITILCTSYDTLPEFQNMSNHHFRIMNNIYLKGSYRYLEAQLRSVYPAIPESGYVNTDMSNGSWGTYITRPFRDVFQPGDQLRVLQCDVNDTLWRPAASFGNWWGWNRDGTFETDPNYGVAGTMMPLAVTLTAKVDNPGTDTVVAKLWWFGQMCDWMDTAAWNAGARWVRFAPVEIRSSDFDSSALYFNQQTYWLRPTPPLYYVRDANPNWPGENQYPGGPVGDPVGSNNETYRHWGNFEYRFAITTTGARAFSLYELQAYDSAYYNLFFAPESLHVADTIAAMFQDQKNMNDSSMAGWYYDEIWNESALKAWVKTNKILSDHGLPTFWINGYAFDDNRQTQMDALYAEFARPENGGLRPQTFMNETYFINGDSNNVVKSWHYPPSFYTRYDSDDPYVRITRTADTLWGRWNLSSKQYNGTQSLQRALDWTYWRVPDDYACQFLSTYQCQHINELELYPGFIDQVRLQHDRGCKLWALLQAGAAGDLITQTRQKSRAPLPEDAASGYAVDDLPMSWRDPSPEEIKLQAWMAVAADADGIMYYFGMPTGPRTDGDGTWGLFDWGDAPNFCSQGAVSAETTPRYDAAKEVDHKILEVTQILNDDFPLVKTYSSRAFELDYPYDWFSLTGCPAILLDTLAYETWYERNYRCVESIQSWAPSILNEDTTAVAAWNANPEEHTYVQISRFRSNYTSPEEEDYWFLIVNRRAQAHEFRKIRLTIEVNQNSMCLNRWADYVLGDSMIVTEAPGDREDCHPTRYLDVVLKPGEAELVHFFRDLSPCDTTLAHIHQLTAIPRNEHGINLHWEQITQTDSGDVLIVDTFFVRASRYLEGPYTTIGFTTTNSYVDTSGWSSYPKCFYQVQACGHLPPEQFRERPTFVSKASKAASQRSIKK